MFKSPPQQTTHTPPYMWQDIFRVEWEVCCTHHLYGGHILFLLYIDMGNVEPDVTEVGRGLTHLGKHITCLIDVALVGKQATWQGEYRIRLDRLKTWGDWTNTCSTTAAPSVENNSYCNCNQNTLVTLCVSNTELWAGMENKMLCIKNCRMIKTA